jgi:HK97 family phage major capsid protein
VPITKATGFGAAITPEEWAGYVLDHLAAASVVLASGATEVRTSAKQIHMPRITGDGAVGWYSELEAIGPGDPVGDELILTPKKVAALTTLSNEAVDDSTPSVLDAVGNAMVKAVAREADRAYFAGTGPANDQPVGIMTLPGLPASIGPVDYAEIITAAGVVRAAGGTPNVAYLNPADLTALQLVVDGNNRPLIQPDPSQGMSETIGGLRIWATPAVPAAQALIAQADQIVVAVRTDASVVVSTDAAFSTDGTVARVVARTDVGVNDLDGLCAIRATAAAATGRAAKAKD